jgi:hypothetical protein
MGFLQKFLPHAAAVIIVLMSCFSSYSQKTDSLKVLAAKEGGITPRLDSAIKKEFSPRKATLRSAIIPGWGQAYNKKYWKIPIVYAALGITGYVFVDNLKTYKEYRSAYATKYRYSLSTATPADTAAFNNLKEIYKVVSLESIRRGRDQFRQYIDYSALVFILFWGLNVVDATVDAHLKSFDISPDLSMKIKPAYNPIANTKGVSMVFSFKHKKTVKASSLY